MTSELNIDYLLITIHNHTKHPNKQNNNISKRQCRQSKTIRSPNNSNKNTEYPNNCQFNSH